MRQKILLATSMLMAGVLMASTVAAEQVTLKFAHEAPENAIKGQTANLFANLVGKYSNGEVKVEVYPGGQLVPTKEEIRAAVRGQVDFIAPFTSYYSSINETWDIFYQPLLFDNVDHAMDAFSGDLGGAVLDKLKDRGLVGLGIWHDGPVYLFTAGDPVTAVDGLKGKKIRVFPNKPLESILHKLGASPISMPATEVYLALQQGVVDGVLTTPTYAAPAKWYEVLKGLNRTIFGIGGYGVAASGKTWAKLDNDQKAAVQRAMDEAVRWNQDQAKKNIGKSIETLKTEGVTVVDPSAAQADAWKELAREVYAEQGDELQGLIKSVKGE